MSLLEKNELDTASYIKIVRKYSRDGNSTFSKDDILKEIDVLLRVKGEYCFLGEAGERSEPEGVLKNELESLKSAIKLKPMRTESGVTTVTVLTKPYACPGQCIFCPNDVRMPKSYIATEPGAQRALMFRFSPYAQVWNRLKALQNIGHPTDKVEMLVLGGTWTSYKEDYKLWFTYNLFKAMNDFGDGICDERLMTKQDISEIFENDFNDDIRKNYSFTWEGVQQSRTEGVNSLIDKSKTNFIEYNKLLQTQEFKAWEKENVVAGDFMNSPTWEILFEEQNRNSKGKCRCVGLVFETRPDRITQKEVLTLRKLGATKVQLGIQILNDEISSLNKRGENIEDAMKAFELLRLWGFKIHVHMMPNLLGATPKLDLESYKLLVNDPHFLPDEIKIYPTSLIANTELENEYKAGNWRPYETQELVELIAQMIAETPEYVRLTRIIRDIPSQEIEAGNKLTNLRQVVEKYMQDNDMQDQNIRAREIKQEKVTFVDLELKIVEYQTTISKELFLEYVKPPLKKGGKGDFIAGFLRLSLPIDNISAMIREIHVYGPSLEISKDSSGDAQHLGLGTKLIEKAKKIAKDLGYNSLKVISAIGTREYYAKRGFEMTEDGLYQLTKLKVNF
ncbi:tRNA uridine(34) 5-carboxymethylaminomethyl modification radical SAM/GNAT enzyme Elp3 [bacterium]|nr:MAG: tRNA uridine(34) 5-carboxymethylaminomethyl modification radical SAM/GNAT enzyme Elp3 [bacterium]